jgi:predicted transcriptional regulator/transcriptional regulator with XRE-family HTH domain
MRDRLGLTQVEMARRLGVSTSYLNLIEHDQRPLTPKLVARFSEVLSVDAHALSEGADSHMAADLAEALADPVFGADGRDPNEILGAVSEWPAVGEAILALYHAYRQQRDKVDELGEVLRQREALANINYDFRTLVTTIRSFAEILLDNPDLDVEQRRHFLGIVVEDSKRLVPLFGGLLDSGSSAGTSAAVDLPIEDATDVLLAHGGYVADLEDAADEVRRVTGLETPADCERAAGGDRTSLTEGLTIEARTLAWAKRLAAEQSREAIERCLDAGRWATDESKTRAFDVFAHYVADAILMPYDQILAAVRELRYDVERICRRFGVGFEEVCRRLATLQRPGAKGVPFHLVKVDMGGNVRLRLGSSGFRVPRHGGTCPLWNVHVAFLTPGVTRAQLSRLPEGAVYFSIARTVPADEPEIVRSPRFSAIELGCDVSFAREIVYADGLDLSAHAAAVPIGTTCRLCERADCRQRALPPYRQPAKIAAQESAATAG